jgi:sporulation protein YlmC with PRC-barrel domain
MGNLTGTQTSKLIGASKVTGAALHNVKGEKVGSVHDLMIDTSSGTIAYAIISFGGFFGLGGDYYPLPWKALKYDMGLGGYVTEITAPQLEGAPTHPRDENFDWTGGYEARMNEYYGSDKFRGLMPFPNSF